tara:strand:- start:1938 stop:2324 length:387 start_codon:yes stop_codon:yes gene_type:complete
MLRRKKFQVIYPEYFDSQLSKKQGRRVNLNLASKDPTLKKLIFACNKLNINFEEQKDKAYPSRWWEKKGRLLIPINKEQKKLKSELIVELAEIIRRIVVKQKPLEKQLNKKENRKERTKSAKNVIRRK